MNIEFTAKLPMEAERAQVKGVTSAFNAEAAKQQGLAESVGANQQRTQEKKEVEPQVKKESELKPKDIAAMVDELNEAIPLRARQLQFAIDEDANRTVISVLDKESGETIRQIPSKEALELIARLREASEGAEQIVGVLVNSKI